MLEEIYKFVQQYADNLVFLVIGSLIGGLTKFWFDAYKNRPSLRFKKNYGHILRALSVANSIETIRPGMRSDLKKCRSLNDEHILPIVAELADLKIEIPESVDICLSIENMLVWLVVWIEFLSELGDLAERGEYRTAKRLYKHWPRTIKNEEDS